jgi:hypothetical protein
MTVVWKYVLLAGLAAGAVFYLQAGLRAAALNIHRLSSWKRIPATVRAVVDFETVEVVAGTEPDQVTLRVPQTYDSGYYAMNEVTVLENPKNPDERRLTGIFDLWNDAFVTTILGLALLTAAWLVWSAPWGVDAVWSAGAWRSAPDAVERTARLEVFEPRESWKANLFYGCVFGLAMGVPCFFVKGAWKPWPTIVAVLSMGFLAWMIQSAIFNFTRSVRVTDAGVEEVTFFGTRRVPWEEFGGLEFQDVQKFFTDLSNAGRWQTRKFSTMPKIDVWAVKDSEGRQIFSLPAEMTPKETFLAMREQLQRRSPAR